MSRADKLKLIIKAAAAMGLVVVIVLAMYLREPAQPAAGTPAVLSAPGVVIDAGHGGYDGGAQWGGAVEKDVNLAITLQLREILLATGYRVALTRYGDYSLIEEEEASNPKKREDMARRLAVIEKHQPDIVILIHCNAIRSTQWSGAQTFYQEGFDQGKLLAEDIQHYLREFTATTRQARPLDLYLLRESSIVGSLVEAGFLSNPAERDLLLQRGYQRILATATWLGISKYLHESGLALED
ncbi:MAG: N-acetylmuramoyl-L-alanine amidase CwlD [Firmicutes bacterium]|nr:N-acetylmuramoyl-L-alanine amidase CwlD [Bacillota bacterium]HOB34561.1 N-acetylmuramoyl-L-alanine amidase [Bacillota bacterium]HPZ90908.1 N-acetylmuramoyl-L-alanine amidase [Bacillota bacterium]HQE01910.1 N-acetylmuramoyl-L-alanine amidase [Bacillota bacterium]